MNHARKRLTKKEIALSNLSQLLMALEQRLFESTLPITVIRDVGNIIARLYFLAASLEEAMEDKTYLCMLLESISRASKEIDEHYRYEHAQYIFELRQIAHTNTKISYLTSIDILNLSDEDIEIIQKIRARALKKQQQILPAISHENLGSHHVGCGD